MPDPIVLVPDPILLEKCPPFGRVTLGSIDLAARMIATLNENRGIGLAAPQIGVLERVIIIDTVPDRAPVVMFDPRIVSYGKEMTALLEGCLSIPGELYRVMRPSELEISWTDYTGVPRTAVVGGITAKCIQHEIDHLEGILISSRGTKVPEKLTA